MTSSQQKESLASTKLKIIVSNTKSRIFGKIPIDAYTQIDKCTSFQMPNYWFTTAYKLHNWDGSHRLLQRPYNIFPTGLLKRVVKALNANAVDVEIEHREENPFKGQKRVPELENIELRDYQKESVCLGLEKSRGIFDLPTGSGKSAVGAAIIKALDLKTLWLTHRKELFKQSQDFLKLYLLKQKIGLVGEGIFEPRKITVGMVPTLYSRIDHEEVKALLASIQVLILDECHRSASQTWYKLSQSIPAYFRIGLSGTPLMRGDNKNLLIIATTGEVLYRMKSAKLTERGLLKETTITFAASGEPSYDAVYDFGVVKNVERNKQVLKYTKRFLKEGRSVLILVRKIEHGNLLYELLTQNQVKTQFIYGDTDKRHRQAYLRQFKQKKLKTLIASTILDEGVDIQGVHGLILAGAGASRIKALQRVGRGMRKDERNDLQVVDFADMTHRFLKKHSLERLQVYKQEGFEIRKERD